MGRLGEGRLGKPRVSRLGGLMAASQIMMHTTTERFICYDALCVDSTLFVFGSPVYIPRCAYGSQAAGRLKAGRNNKG